VRAACISTLWVGLAGTLWVNVGVKIPLAQRVACAPVRVCPAACMVFTTIYYYKLP
jgi:hypothetical protein